MRLILLFVLFTVNLVGFAQNINFEQKLINVNNEFKKLSNANNLQAKNVELTNELGCTPTLSTGIITGSPVCAGSFISVPYNFTDCVDAGNTFTVELSDAFGSFASPTIIGSLTSATSGLILATIPSSITTVGNGYRIRVNASAPATIGIDNGIDLTIIPKPNSGFNVNSLAQCITTNNFIFSNTSTGSITSFYWDLGDGTTSSSTNLNKVYATAGNYNVKLVVTGSNGCKDSVIRTISVNSKPTSNYTINNASLCLGNTFNFTNNSSISFGNISYVWNFGDNTNSTTINASHVYTTSGNFDVKLIASSNGGCVDSFSQSVSVLQKEAALFSVNNLSQCVNNNFVFTNNTSGNTTSYWTFGDGITSTLTSPAKIYSTSGTYDVKLVVTNINGCKDSIEKTVTVLNKPTPSFNITGNTNCSNNSTFTFNNTSSGTGNSYSWMFGDGNSSSSVNPTNTYNLEGTYIVQLLVVGANGCRDSISKSLTFSSNAVANFVINDSTQCSDNNSFIFTNTSSGGVVNSDWSFGDGITSVVTSPVKNYQNAGVYAVKLLVTNSNGCKDSTTKQVTVYSKPTANFITSGTVNCINSLTMQTTNTSTGLGNTYLWNFGDGSTSTTVSPSHTYSSFGTYSVKLIVTNTNGCLDSITRTVTFTSKPVALFNISNNTTQCLNTNSFSFANNSTFSQTYLWTFGDGARSTLANPTLKTYTSAGIYSVKLLTTNVNGCKDSITQNLTVVNVPKAAFNSIFETCGKLDVQFKQLDSSNTAFTSWIFGDATTKNNVSSTTHIYSTFGTYNIKFYAYDATTTCVDSAIKTITLYPAPIASIQNSSSNKQCFNGNRFNFSSNSQFANSFFWTFGDGSTSTLQIPLPKTYSSPGIYNVKLVVMNSVGCTDTVTMKDTVLPSPKANFNVIYQPCNRNGIKFIQLDTINTKYSAWDFGDGSGASDVFNTTHSFASINSFSIKYYAYDSNFYCVDSAAKTITFSDIPAAGIGYPYNSKQCFNANSFAHTNTSIGGTTYFWEFGDGSTSNAVTPPAKTYNAPGIYTVKLTAYNASGCFGTTTVLDTVLPSPKAAFTISNQTCNDFSFQIAQSNTLGTKWSYINFGDGKDTADVFSVAHSYSVAGSYSVKYFAYDSNFYCTDSAMSIINIVPKAIAGITYLGSLNLTQCSNNNSFTFLDASTNANTHLWNFGDGSTSTSVNPSTHIYATSGNYIVKHIVTNINGCKDSTSILVKVVPSPKANFTATILQPCGLGVKFLQTDSLNTLISTWNFGDGNFDIDKSSVTHIYAAPGTYTIKYYAFDTTVIYCVDSATQIIKINPKPTPGFTVNTISQCSNNNSFSFTNNSTNGVSYLWYYGDGSFSTQQTPSNKTYSSAGNYIVKQIVTNASGCIDSITKTVTVLQSPIANFTATFNNCTNLTAQFVQANTSNTIFSAWDFGDGNVASDVFSVSHTYNSAGTYTIKYYAYNAGFTCVDSATKTITLTSNPVANFSYNNLLQCVNNNSVALQNNSTNATSYLWTFGDGGFSFATNPTITYNTAGTYLIKLIATNANGCKDSITKYVTILPKPVPSFNIVGNAQCNSGLTISFDNTTPGIGNSYLWYFGDGDTSVSSSVTKAYVASGTYNVKLIVTNASGCKDSISKQITFSSKPTAAFIYSSNNQCLNPTFTFINNSINYTSVNWSFGDGGISTAVSPIHTYVTSGTYIVKLIATNANGCIDSFVNTIIINPKPIAGFGITGATGCTTNKTISIQDNAVNATSYYYDFGDGTTSTLSNPTVTYTTAGTYVIKQVVTNANGCKDSSSKTVVFNSFPVVSFNVNDANQCLNNNLFSFVNNSINTISYLWSFGDGTTSTLSNPTKTYSSVGTYTIKLIATSALGCKDSATLIVSVLPKPISLFSFNGIINCTNNRTINIINNAIGATAYYYDFGDGTNAVTATPIKTYNAPGTYIIKQIVSNANGCKDSTTQTVTITGIPVAAFSVTTSSNCTNNLAININNTSANATIYNWSFGDGTTSSLAVPSKTYLAAGIYTIKLVVSNSSGCKDSILQTITLSAKPIAAFTVPNFTNCIVGNTFSFTNNSTNAVSYLWNFGDGGTSSLTSPSYTFNNSGTYNVKLVVTSANGCKDSMIRTISYVARPIAAFTSIASTSCNNSFAFNNTSVSNATSSSYMWTFGDASFSTLQNPVKAYTTAGTYTVVLIVTNSNGCKDTTYQTVTVSSKPIAAFTIPNFNSCNNSNSITVQSTSTNVTSLNWKFGDGTTATGANVNKTYSTAGTYIITLVVTNANGCTDSIIKTITLSAKPVASFNVNNLSQCVNGNSFSFTNSSSISSGTIQYSWLFGDGSTSMLTNPIKVYSSPGVYNVKLIATNSNGSCSDTSSIQVTVLAKPTSVFNILNSSLCSNTKTVVFNNTSSNVSSSIWNFGDGNSSTLYNPSNTYLNYGNYTISLISKNANGCSDTLSKSINLQALPSAIFNVNNNSQCFKNNNFVFTNNSTNAVNYIWNFGDNVGSITTNTSHSYNVAGNYVIGLIATNTNGCVDSAKATITVKPSSAANFSFSGNTSCTNNLTLAFTNLSSGTNNTYLWSFGDGLNSTATSPSYTYANTGNYTIRLVTSNASGCSDTATQNVIFTAKPTSSFSVVGVTQCVNNNSYLFNNASINAISYLWNFGDGTTSTLESPNHSYTTAGNYTVTLQSINGTGCTSTSTANITVAAMPIPSFTLGSFNACSGNASIALNNTSTGATSYNWNFGNGNTSNAVNPTVTYATAGAYIITLSAISSNGCTTTTTQTVTIYDKIVSNFSLASSATQCVGSNIFSFVNNSSNASSYLWNFGDGTTSILNSPSHIYATSGTYTITLTVSNNNGCSATNSTVVNVYAKPIASFNLSNYNSCINNRTISPLNSSSNASGYVWDFGDGILTNETNPTHTYVNAGLYVITLVSSNANGCSDTLKRTISIENKPISLFAITGNTTQCVGSNIFSFVNNSSNASSYLWNFGDGTTSTLNSPTHTYLGSGTFIVTLTVTNNSGCSVASAATVTVLSKPITSFNLSNYNSCINNRTISPANTSSNASSYVWDFGDGILTNETNPTHTYVNAGLYVITLVSSNANGCSDTLKRTISIENKPISLFAITGNATQCVGSNIFSFVNNSSNASSYLWNFGDGTTSTLNSPTHTYLGSGTFIVTLTVTNNSGCSVASAVTVTVLSKPIASFNLSNYNSCINNRTISPTNTSSNASSYIWDFGDGILTNEINPTHTYVNAGLYVVTLISSNLNGCSDTLKRTVTITNKPISLFVIGGNVSQCINNNVFSFVNYSTNALTSVWDFGDGTTTTGTNAVHSYLTAGIYTVVLTITSSNGCIATSSQTISVNTKPNATFVLDASSQCLSGNIFHFTNTSVNLNNVNYLWNFGDSTFTTQTNAIKTYAKAGTYNVILTAKNTNGCVDSAIKTVVINSTIISKFVVNSSSVAQCINSTIEFNNRTIGTATSYLWNFGDGTTSTLANPTHSYSNAGNYVVTLLSYSSNCIDSSSQTIVIGVRPTANFTATATNSCSSNYNLVSTSNGNIVNYAWKLSDTVINGSANLIYGFIKAGDQSVKLVVSSAPGCSDSITKTVTVLPKPAVSYSQNAVVGCVNDNSFVFISNTTANALSISNFWDFGDGTTSAGTSVTKSYSKPGVYNVKLISTVVSTGCRDSISQPVTVFPKPTGTISGNVAVCKGTSAKLKFNFSGRSPFSATYTDGVSNFTINNISDSAFEVSVVPGVTTTYRLLSVKDAICTANENDLPSTATVTINTLTYTKQPENIVTCMGKDVVFTSTAFSNTTFTYQWFKNGIAITGATKDTLLLTNITSSDNGYYKLAAVLACGSYTSNTVTLRVDPLPPAPSFISNYTYCQYDTAQPLKATGNLIKWYDNSSSGIGSTIPPVPSTRIAGTYQYWVTNTTLPTCETPRFVVNTTVLPAPTITTKVVGSTTLIPTQTTTLTAFPSTNAIGVKWYYNGLYLGLTPNNKVVVDYSKPGTYYAEAITTDGCKARTDSIVIKTNAGAASSSNASNLLVYPNPTRSFINMYFNNPVNENVTIRVVNMLGQILKQMPYKYTAASQIVKMDVTGLHPEMYVVEIVNHLGATIARNLFIKVD